jgi:general secretion pathway protein D
VTPFLSARAIRLPAIVAAGVLALCPFMAQAQAPAAPATAASNPAPLAASNGDDKITVNFVNADIQSVIKTVGQHTGRNFILDPRVTGTVNIVSDKPVSRDLLYQIFLSALRVQGYAAVEEGGFVKIVPEAEAKTNAGPVGEQAARVPGDRIVTQVFILQNESAVQLVPVLRPLVTANNFIAAYPNNNAIVITDYAENVRRIERIIHSIDLPSGADVQIIKLANASAIDIAQMLQRVVPEMSPTPSAPGTPPKAAVAVDSRTNSLLVRSDAPQLMARIKSLALGLDTPGAGTGNIYVVFLRNAEAVRIAETLRALMSGAESSRSTTTLTTPGGNTQTQSTATLTSATPPASIASPNSIIQAYPPTNSIIIKIESIYSRSFAKRGTLC